MPSGGRGGVVAGLGEHERAGAERDLGAPGLPAAQPEQRRLLVAGGGAHRDALDRGVDRVGVDDRRQQRARDAEQVEQLVVPVGPPSGHSSERAGVADVGDVDAAQPVQQPRRDVAVGEVAAVATWSSTQRSLVAGKVASSSSPVRSRTSAACSRSAAHSSSVRRSCHTIAGWTARPRRAIPDDEGLGLVGDAERGDVRTARRGDRLGAPRRRAPRVLLDEPGRRERARDGHRAPRPHLAQLGVERDAARARRALVEPEDERHRAHRGGARRAPRGTRRARASSSRSASAARAAATRARQPSTSRARALGVPAELVGHQRRGRRGGGRARGRAR